ncbi:MAG: hypothetical protein QXW47_00075 [Candidatus Jordarchaeales archaeon]
MRINETSIICVIISKNPSSWKDASLLPKLIDRVTLSMGTLEYHGRVSQQLQNRKISSHYIYTMITRVIGNYNKGGLLRREKRFAFQI